MIWIALWIYADIYLVENKPTPLYDISQEICSAGMLTQSNLII